MQVFILRKDTADIIGKIALQLDDNLDFFVCIQRSGPNFLDAHFIVGEFFKEVCFLVGEKFWAAEFDKTAISRYSKWANFEGPIRSGRK